MKPTALVLGDMGEVGDRGAEFHAEVGLYAKEKGIVSIFACGSATPDAVKAFGPGATHFAHLKELIERAGKAKTILVKGSRFMKMEQVVAALAGEVRDENGAAH